MPTPELHNVYLTEAGDGTGPISHLGDYSVTPVTIWYAPPSPQTFLVKRLTVLLGDGGSGWRPGNYGAVPALDPGLKVSIQDAEGQDILRLDAGHRITCNACWTFRSGFSIYSTTGVGDDYLTVVWDFRESNGVLVPLTQGQRFAVELTDDLTALVEHQFRLDGLIPQMDKRRRSWDESVGLQYIS